MKDLIKPHATVVKAYKNSSKIMLNNKSLIFAANRNKSRRVKILVYKLVHEFLQRRPFCN